MQKEESLVTLDFLCVSTDLYGTASARLAAGLLTSGGATGRQRVRVRARARERDWIKK